MTFYPQCRITLKHKHRLHDRLNNLIIAVEALTVAGNFLRGEPAKWTAPTVAALDCVQLPISVKVPVWGPLEAALNDQYPDAIHIDFLEISPPIPEYSVWAAGLQKRHLTFGLIKVAINMIIPIFVEFFESYKQFLFDNMKRPENWPMIWRFGWAVRNAMSHDGCIYFENNKTVPVSWYSLTYSHANNGHRILGVKNADLGVGDIVVLMFEMNDELDRVNCPLII